MDSPLTTGSDSDDPDDYFMSLCSDVISALSDIHQEQQHQRQSLASLARVVQSLSDKVPPAPTKVQQGMQDQRRSLASLMRRVDSDTAFLATSMGEIKQEQEHHRQGLASLTGLVESLRDTLSSPPAMVQKELQDQRQNLASLTSLVQALNYRLSSTPVNRPAPQVLLPKLPLWRPVLPVPNILTDLTVLPGWIAFMKAKLRMDGDSIGTSEDQFWYICGLLGTSQWGVNLRELFLTSLTNSHSAGEVEPDLAFALLGNLAWSKGVVFRTEPRGIADRALGGGGDADPVTPGSD